jgi:hypothetical protein
MLSFLKFPILAQRENSFTGKSHMHNDQQEEEKRNSNPHQIASMALPRIVLSAVTKNLNVFITISGYLWW